MPEITFDCPSCGQSLEAPAEYAGEEVACPNCQTTLTVPGPITIIIPETEAAAEAEPGATDASTAVCAECGAPMEPDAVLCLKCGYHQTLKRRIQTDFDGA